MNKLKLVILFAIFQNFTKKDQLIEKNIKNMLKKLFSRFNNVVVYFFI